MPASLPEPERENLVRPRDRASNTRQGSRRQCQGGGTGSQHKRSECRHSRHAWQVRPLQLKLLALMLLLLLLPLLLLLVV